MKQTTSVGFALFIMTAAGLLLILTFPWSGRVLWPALAAWFGVPHFLVFFLIQATGCAILGIHRWPWLLVGSALAGALAGAAGYHVLIFTFGHLPPQITLLRHIAATGACASAMVIGYMIMARPGSTKSA